MTLNDLIKFAKHYGIDFNEEIKCLVDKKYDEKDLDTVGDLAVCENNKLCIIPSQETYNWLRELGSHIYASTYREAYEKFGFGYEKDDTFIFKYNREDWDKD